MKIILSDFEAHLRFAPLSLTRPIGDIRVGLFTNLERWSILLPDDHIGFQSESYLSDEFEELHDGSDKIFIWNNASVYDFSIVKLFEFITQVTF